MSVYSSQIKHWMIRPGVRNIRADPTISDTLKAGTAVLEYSSCGCLIIYLFVWKLYPYPILTLVVVSPSENKDILITNDSHPRFRLFFDEDAVMRKWSSILHLILYLCFSKFLSHSHHFYKLLLTFHVLIFPWCKQCRHLFLK